MTREKLGVLFGFMGLVAILVGGMFLGGCVKKIKKPPEQEYVKVEVPVPEVKVVEKVVEKIVKVPAYREVIKEVEAFRPQTLSVYFRTDSNTLNDEAKKVIAYVVGYLKDHPEACVELVGHADERGDYGYNETLSLARANAVTLALINSGIDKYFISEWAVGETENMCMDFTPDCWAQNRRVVIRIVKGL